MGDTTSVRGFGASIFVASFWSTPPDAAAGSIAESLGTSLQAANARMDKAIALNEAKGLQHLCCIVFSFTCRHDWDHERVCRQISLNDKCGR